MLEKISSKYILQEIIKNHLDKKVYLQLVQYNKKLQEKLKIKLKDYKYCSERVIIDLYPKKDLPKGQFYFININEKERQYFHFFFDENKKEENRNYITENDKINKIRVIIESKIKSFGRLFCDCDCLEKINFIKCERNDIQNLYDTFRNCRSLIEVNISKLKQIM